MHDLYRLICQIKTGCQVVTSWLLLALLILETTFEVPASDHQIASFNVAY